MALKKCIECGQDVSTNASACPHCGARATAKPSAIIRYGGGFLIVAFALGILGSMITDKSADTNTAQAGAKDAPTSNSMGQERLSTDAAAVKASHDSMAAVEKDFFEAQDKLLASIQGAERMKGVSRADQVGFESDVQDLIDAMNRAAMRGESLAAPSLSNQEGSRHIAAAVDAHKKWAIAQQAKLGAVLLGQVDLAKTYGNQADAMAAQEAMELIMAYKAVGLPI